MEMTLFTTAGFTAFQERLKVQPTLYKTVRTIALYMLSGGYKGLSMEHVLNEIRWNPNVSKIGIPEGEQFALNNNHRSFLTRMFLTEFPEFRDKFELRTSKAGADAVPESEYKKLIERYGI